MLEQNFKFKSIMLVDDNNIDLYITARVLSNSNFAKDIKEYTSAKKALNFLQENQNDFNQLPQIIFVDIYMPQMIGKNEMYFISERRKNGRSFLL